MTSLQQLFHNTSQKQQQQNSGSAHSSSLIVPVASTARITADRNNHTMANMHHGSIITGYNNGTNKINAPSNHTPTTDTTVRAGDSVRCSASPWTLVGRDYGNTTGAHTAPSSRSHSSIPSIRPSLTSSPSLPGTHTTANTVSPIDPSATFSTSMTAGAAAAATVHSLPSRQSLLTLASRATKPAPFMLQASQTMPSCDSIASTTDATIPETTSHPNHAITSSQTAATTTLLRGTPAPPRCKDVTNNDDGANGDDTHTNGGSNSPSSVPNTVTRHVDPTLPATLTRNQSQMDDKESPSLIKRWLPILGFAIVVIIIGIIIYILILRNKGKKRNKNQAKPHGGSTSRSNTDKGSSPIAQDKTERKGFVKRLFGRLGLASLGSPRQQPSSATTSESQHYGSQDAPRPSTAALSSHQEQQQSQQPSIPYYYNNHHHPYGHHHPSTHPYHHASQGLPTTSPMVPPRPHHTTVSVTPLTAPTIHNIMIPPVPCAQHDYASRSPQPPHPHMQQQSQSTTTALHYTPPLTVPPASQQQQYMPPQSQHCTIASSPSCSIPPPHRSLIPSSMPPSCIAAASSQLHPPPPPSHLAHTMIPASSSHPHSSLPGTMSAMTTTNTVPSMATTLAPMHHRIPPLSTTGPSPPTTSPPPQQQQSVQQWTFHRGDVSTQQQDMSLPSQNVPPIQSAHQQYHHPQYRMVGGASQTVPTLSIPDPLALPTSQPHSLQQQQSPTAAATGTTQTLSPSFVQPPTSQETMLHTSVNPSHPTSNVNLHHGTTTTTTTLTMMPNGPVVHTADSNFPMASQNHKGSITSVTSDANITSVDTSVQSPSPPSLSSCQDTITTGTASTKPSVDNIQSSH